MFLPSPSFCSPLPPLPSRTVPFPGKGEGSQFRIIKELLNYPVGSTHPGVNCLKFEIIFLTIQLRTNDKWLYLLNYESS
jgi:hypothetical protein